MIESARVVSAVTPIFFLGDSNTIVFDNLLFECPKFFAQPFVTRAAYCRGLTAAAFTSESGELHPLIVESLLRHLLAIGDSSSWRETHAAMAALLPKREFKEIGDAWNRWKSTANDHIGSRVIVVMVGTLDFEAVLRTLPAGCDFACEDERFVLDKFPEKPVGQYVPANVVDDLAADRLKPLARGLALLQEAGFENVYLHSLQPPTLDDHKFAKLRLTCTQAALRYKVVLTINAKFRDLCERQGIRYLDMWDATTAGGVVDPRFEFDGVHLNKAAAHLSACAVLSDLAGRVLPKKLDLTELQQRDAATRAEAPAAPTARR